MTNWFYYPLDTREEFEEEDDYFLGTMLIINIQKMIGQKCISQAHEINCRYIVGILNASKYYWPKHI